MSTFVASWGVLGTGGICKKFVLDITYPPSNRGVSDVSHAVAAIASRSKSKAAEFIQENCPSGSAAQKDGKVTEKPIACEGLAELLSNSKVNVVYIGTPNNCHYDDTKACIEAGKHVLLEKPATLNAAEFLNLSKMAKQKKVFLMEAMWIRYNPTMYLLQDFIFKENVIGDVRAIFSDLSDSFADQVADDHRALNPELGGGALLDMGPYPLSYAMMLLYHHPKNKQQLPQAIQGTVLKAHTGVDLTSSFSLTFPNLKATACLSTSLAYNTPAECATRIIGTTGEIVIPSPCARPTKVSVRKPEDKGKEFKEVKSYETPMDGWGLQYEADEVARCISASKLESDRMPHSETEITMKIFDTIRQQGDFNFPAGLERA